MKKNEDALEKEESLLRKMAEQKKAQAKDDKKSKKRISDLIGNVGAFIFLFSPILLIFGIWSYNHLPSQVQRKESIEYYNNLRLAKVDSTVHYKQDSLSILYDPKDTLDFLKYKEHEIIEQLTVLNSHDTIYLRWRNGRKLYGQGDYSLINPDQNGPFRIIIKTNNIAYSSSYVRFDSIQVMNWPHRPFHLIYLDRLSEESIRTLIKEAEKTWNHLYYDSIQ
jgi:hypothetical protein